MTDLRKAAEMAIEALCSANPIGHALEDYEYHNKATEALRQALAQPEQEHKPWCDYLNIMLTSLPPQKAKCNCKQAQPEQEPMAVLKVWDEKEQKHVLINYYLTPPSKQEEK